MSGARRCGSRVWGVWQSARGRCRALLQIATITQVRKMPAIGRTWPACSASPASRAENSSYVDKLASTPYRPQDIVMHGEGGRYAEWSALCGPSTNPRRGIERAYLELCTLRSHLP